MTLGVIAIVPMIHFARPASVRSELQMEAGHIQ